MHNGKMLAIGSAFLISYYIVKLWSIFSSVHVFSFCFLFLCFFLQKNVALMKSCLRSVLFTFSSPSTVICFPQANADAVSINKHQVALLPLGEWTEGGPRSAE